MKKINDLKEPKIFQMFSRRPLSKKDKGNQRFYDSLDPDIDEIERKRLMLDFLYRRDGDVIEAMNCGRPDATMRQVAFCESLLNAIQTDEKSWSEKGVDVLKALDRNNAEALLIALCGWGANSLAMRAGLIPKTGDIGDIAFDYYDDLEGKLFVNWSNGKQTFSQCSVSWDLELVDFDSNIFTIYNNSAKIESVIVEVTPYYADECTCFNCISREERDRTNDEFSYWYRLDDEDEDIDPDDDNEE